MKESQSIKVKYDISTVQITSINWISIKLTNLLVDHHIKKTYNLN